MIKYLRKKFDGLKNALLALIALLVILAAFAFAGWLLYLVIGLLFSITLKGFLITAGAICFVVVFGGVAFILHQISHGN